MDSISRSGLDALDGIFAVLRAFVLVAGRVKASESPSGFQPGQLNRRRVLEIAICEKWRVWVFGRRNHHLRTAIQVCWERLGVS